MVFTSAVSVIGGYSVWWDNEQQVCSWVGRSGDADGGNMEVTAGQMGVAGWATTGNDLMKSGNNKRQVGETQN